MKAHCMEYMTLLSGSLDQKNCSKVAKAAWIGVNRSDNINQDIEAAKIGDKTRKDPSTTPSNSVMYCECDIEL